MFRRGSLTTKRLLFQGGLGLFLCFWAVSSYAQSELPIVSATASSYYSIYTPAKTKDNNLSTYWRGASYKTYWWLKLDFGTAYPLEQVSLWWHKDYGSIDYAIQTSSDGVNWTNRYANLSSSAGTTNPYKLTYALSGAYRYLRIYITKAQRTYPIIYEVKVYKDTTPPTGTIKVNNDTAYTNQTQVSLNLAASDTSGMDKMQFSNDNTNWSTPEVYSSVKTWNLSSGDGTKTVYVRFSDKAGNWSQSYSDSIILDTQAPLPPTINPVTTPTTTNSQTLTGTKSQDAVSLVITCPTATIGVPGYPSVTSWSSAVTNLTLGTNTISIKAKDAAGNESSSVTASIVYGRAPSIGTINPESGQASPEEQITFTTTFIDPDGWQNLYYGLFIINTAIVGKDCFYAYYNQNTNKLYLIKDDGTAWLDGYPPGSSNIIENSYAKLDCSKTTVSGSGTTLTIKWSVTFKSAFAGVKNTYLYARDDANLYTGWVKKGDYCIMRKPLTAP